MKKKVVVTLKARKPAKKVTGAVKMSASEMETAALYFAASNMCWVEKERMLAKIQMYLTKSEDGTYDFSAVSAPFEGFLLRESPMELGENDVIDGLRMEKKDWLKCFKEKNKYCMTEWAKDLKKLA